MLGDWIISLEGTPAGANAAMILALVSAVAHAAMGALQKGRHDPWLSRGSIDISASIMAAPIAIWLVPWPDPALFGVLLGAVIIHIGYKWSLAMAYSRGAFTAVYPVVRGTGPVATVLFAGVVFGEFFTLGQWLGVALLSGGICCLAMVNLADKAVDPRVLRGALLLAVLTGIITAIYTVYDAYGIRMAPDPFTFLAWFFFLDGLVFPNLLWRRWRAVPRDALVPLMQRGTIGALFAFLSFGSVFLATRLDKVGEAAALRETSVIFAALIGYFFLGETIGRTRALLMLGIAGGAVLVEFG